jgi:purine-binding chemotaxis protein CheW
VVFSLGGEEYGVKINQVREIMKTGDVTMVPNAPDFIRGIINLRGKIVVVIDLEKRFLLKRAEEFTGKHIIISEMAESTFGIMVDEVTEVMRIAAENIKDAPSIITKKINANYLVGVGTIKDRLLILLDINKVLAEEELVDLSKSGGKHFRKIKPKVEDEGLEEIPEAEELEEAEPEKKAEEDEIEEEVKPESVPEEPEKINAPVKKEPKEIAKPAIKKLETKSIPKTALKPISTVTKKPALKVTPKPAAKLALTAKKTNIPKVTKKPEDLPKQSSAEPSTKVERKPIKTARKKEVKSKRS